MNQKVRQRNQQIREQQYTQHIQKQAMEYERRSIFTPKLVNVMVRHCIPIMCKSK
jgi:hypothetical protein